MNNDYWVIGPVTVTSITMPSGTVAPICDSNPECTKDPYSCIARSGSMVNPRFGKEGYDARGGTGPRSYDPNLCRLAPIALVLGDSLLSVASKTTTETFANTQTAAVLTVVDVPQSSDRFRPPFTRPSRVPKSADDPLSFSVNQIQWNLLPALPLVPGTPSLEKTAAFFARPWLANCQGWLCNKVAPSDNMPAYGREFGMQTSEGALQLLLNYSNELKKPLLTGFIQVGIDYYGALLDKGEWMADAGIFQGRKYPILFAGIMLNHAGMKEIGTTHSTYLSDYGTRHVFAEDGQTYYFNDPLLPEYVDRVTQKICFVPNENCVQVRGAKGWTDKYNGGEGDIVLWRIREGENFGMVGVHEHLSITQWDDTNYSLSAESYRRCCASMSFIGYALAAKLMNAQSLWNHNAFFDYVERWMTKDDTEFQKEFYRVYEYNIGFNQGRSHDPFIDAMWDAYNQSSGGVFAIFTADPTDGGVPLTVHFDASKSQSTNGDNTIVKYEWDFGDNQQGNGKIIDHEFTRIGVFTVRLTVTDSIGKKATSMKKITVTQPIDVGLLFFLPLDGSKEDASVKKRTINCGSTGCPDFVTGHKGQAIESDGTTNGKHLSVPDSSDIVGMPKISFAFWAKKTTASEGGSVFTRTGGYLFVIGSNYVRTFLNFQDRSESHITKTTETINDTQWHHYALTFDGQTVRVYVDGTEIASDSSANGKTISQNWPGYDIGILRPFKGALDEMRMYNRGLSTQEIQTLYNQ